MVFNEISLTGFYWLELYKYKKFRLNLETGMEKNRQGERKFVNLVEFWAGPFCVGTLGWPIRCSGVEFWHRL